nr:MAG TPA: hypothetical protein [Caudoviricetes sp.]
MEVKKNKRTINIIYFKYRLFSYFNDIYINAT